MDPAQPRVPDFLPTARPAGDIGDAILRLYRQLAQAGQRAEAAERAAQEQVTAHRQSTDAVIAALAAAQFEFERLLPRALPALEQAGARDALRAIDLFLREGSQTLERQRVEVHDLVGRALTSEMAEVVEVTMAIPDGSVRETVIRETLRPLVRLAGRVVGTAVVNTSVPTGEAEGEGGPGA